MRARLLPRPGREKGWGEGPNDGEAKSKASAFGVPASAGGAIEFPGGPGILTIVSSARAPPPKGGTPYPDQSEKLLRVGEQVEARLGLL